MRSNNFKRAGIITRIFLASFSSGMTEVPFNLGDLRDGDLRWCEEFGCKPEKNPSDIVYNFRHARSPMPEAIQDRAPDGLEWQILGTGKGKYKFTLVKHHSFFADLNLPVVEIPDLASTRILMPSKKLDEQAMLAMVKQNDLVAGFMGCRLSQRQSHYRTYVIDMGQVEIDDLYVGNDMDTGERVMVPVQAKNGNDAPLNAIQIEQDIRACMQMDATFQPRPLGIIAFPDRLVFMAFARRDGHVEAIKERHYSLVSSSPTRRDAADAAQ